MIKTKEEIRKHRYASDLTDKGFEYIITKIKAGMTEIEIAKILDEYMFSLGATATAFDTIVASGENSSNIHWAPTDRKIQEKDIILLDFGYVIDGVCSDMSRTVFVGGITEKQQSIYNLVYNTMLNAIKNIEPGMTSKEADLTRQKTDFRRWL